MGKTARWLYVSVKLRNFNALIARPVIQAETVHQILKYYYYLLREINMFIVCTAYSRSHYIVANKNVLLIIYIFCTSIK